LGANPAPMRGTRFPRKQSTGAPGKGKRKKTQEKSLSFPVAAGDSSAIARPTSGQITLNAAGRAGAFGCPEFSCGKHKKNVRVADGAVAARGQIAAQPWGYP